MGKISDKELNALKNTFDSMNNDKGRLGLIMINELKFMNKTLSKLKKEIDKKGVITDMDQGKYSIKRSNPALNTYNITIKNYQSILNKLDNILPNEIIYDDGFEEDELI